MVVAPHWQHYAHWHDEKKRRTSYTQENETNHEGLKRQMDKQIGAWPAIVGT
jgi:hypothetical protein